MCHNDIHIQAHVTETTWRPASYENIFTQFSMCKFNFKLLNFENVLRQYCYLSQLSHMKISTVKSLVFTSLVYCCSYTLQFPCILLLARTHNSQSGQWHYVSSLLLQFEYYHFYWKFVKLIIFHGELQTKTAYDSEKADSVLNGCNTKKIKLHMWTYTASRRLSTSPKWRVRS